MNQYQVNPGDVIEFTLKGERRTAVAMLISDEGDILLDLIDDDGLAWGELDRLEDLAVFKPDSNEVPVAA
jgi:hypothetical protein